MTWRESNRSAIHYGGVFWGKWARGDGHIAVNDSSIEIVHPLKKHGKIRLSEYNDGIEWVSPDGQKRKLPYKPGVLRQEAACLAQILEHSGFLDDHEMPKPLTTVQYYANLPKDIEELKSWMERNSSLQTTKFTISVEEDGALLTQWNYDGGVLSIEMSDHHIRWGRGYDLSCSEPDEKMLIGKTWLNILSGHQEEVHGILSFSSQELKDEEPLALPEETVFSQPSTRQISK